MTMAITMEMPRVTADWQLDRAYETDTAAALERAMNTDDDFPRTDIASDMSDADHFIGQAIQKLCTAADMADKFGKAKELDELIARLEDFRCDANAYRKGLERK